MFSSDTATPPVNDIETLLESASKTRNSDPQKALGYAIQAVELLKPGTPPGQRARVFNAVTGYYLTLGHNKEALQFAGKAMEAAGKSGDLNKQGIAAINLGRITRITGRYNETFTHLQRALDIFKEIGDRQHTADAYLYMGLLYWDYSEYPRALDFFLKAGVIYRSLNDLSGLAVVAKNRGIIYWEMQEWEKSLEHYREAGELYKKLGDRLGNAMILHNSALVFYKQKRYDEALVNFKRSMEIKKKLGSLRGLADTYEDMAKVYEELGDNSRALSYLSEALTLRRQNREGLGVSDSLIEISRLYRKTGRLREALKAANDGTELAEQMKIKNEMLRGYLELSNIFSALNRFREALEYFKKYKQVHDSIYNDNALQQVRVLQYRYDTGIKKQAIALMKREEQRREMELKEQVLFTHIIIAAVVAILGTIIFLVYLNRAKDRLTVTLKDESAAHQQTMKQLKDSEEKFKTLSEQAIVGVYIIQDNVLKYVNPYFLIMSGFSLEETLERSPLDFIYPDDWETVEQRIGLHMQGKGENLPTFHFRGVRKDGEINYMESYGTLIYYEGRPAILGSIFDVTKQKRISDALLQRRKLESIGLLAAGIAHDFNNLLGVILGYLDMGMEETLSKPKAVDCLKKADTAARQASELVKTIITLHQEKKAEQE